MKRDRNFQSESGDNKMIKELWKALGIDPVTTPEHLTLGEIGIESMFAVELQQELERKFNIKISINIIKIIDVKVLKDYESGRTDIIEKNLHLLNRTRDILGIYKFIIPSEPITRLNNVRNGKPIYFMPPFEITFSAYEEMAKRFDRPVIGINWTKDMNKFQTFKEFKLYIIELITKLEPKGKLDLVGYFDSMDIMVKLLMKGMVNKGVAIDIYNDKRFKKVLTDDVLIDFVAEFLSLELPVSFYNMLMREIKNEPDLDSKIHKIVSELKEIAGRGMIANDFEEIFQILFKRAEMILKYRSKLIGKVPDSIKKTGKNLSKKSSRKVFIKFAALKGSEVIRDSDSLNQKNVIIFHTILSDLGKLFYFRGNRLGTMADKMVSKMAPL